LGLAGQIATAIESTRLLEEANIFRQFVDASGQGMGFATLEGDLIYVNPKFADLLDEPKPEQVISKPLSLYFSPETQSHLQDEILPALNQIGHWSGELPLYTRRGKVIATIQNYSLTRDKNGNPQYLANVVTDITTQKQGEAELEARLQELGALQRMMTREGWQAFQAARAELVQGYLFDQTLVQPLVAKAAAPDEGNGNSSTILAPSLSGPKNGRTIINKMAVQGEIIGQIGVYDDPHQPLTTEDQEFLDAVTEQVAEALERARLLEQTQKRAVEIEAVAQVGAVASTNLDMKALMQAVVDLTKTTFGFYHVHIYLFDEMLDILVLASGAGQVGQRMLKEGREIPLQQRQSLVARAARNRWGVIVNDVQKDPGFLPHPLLPETKS
jgi:PAS domain S-box-containing protein